MSELYHTKAVAMAKKRSNPSSSSDSDKDVVAKKSRNAKEVVANGAGSSVRTREVVSAAASAAATNNLIAIEPTANNSHAARASTLSTKANGSKNTGNSFLKSLRLTKSQPNDTSDTATKGNRAATADAPAGATTATAASKSNNTDKKKNDDRRGSSLLTVFLFALNVAAVAYIVSQHTLHNLNQMKCASTVHKLQMELSDTKDEIKLLTKAMETLEVGNQKNHPEVIMKDHLEGMKGILLGSMTIEEGHKQVLTSKELEDWQQLLRTLEEDRMSKMNDFNDKLKSLL